MAVDRREIPITPQDIEADRLSSCEGKTLFRTRGDATKAMARVRKGGLRKNMEHNSGFQMRVYPCRFCPGFHFGREKMKKTRKHSKRITLD